LSRRPPGRTAAFEAGWPAALRRARGVVVMTGAGVSVESGLRPFRGPDGWWKGRDPARLATPEAFAADPALVSEWYDARRLAALAPSPTLHTKRSPSWSGGCCRAAAASRC
jgi:NAD-dependent deacetylase